MKALVLGATGAVGRHIVESLIDNHEIQEIHVFVPSSSYVYISKGKPFILLILMNLVNGHT